MFEIFVLSNKATVAESEASVEATVYFPEIDHSIHIYYKETKKCDTNSVPMDQNKQ